MAPELTETKPAGVVVRFVGNPDDGYEIQLENNAELADEAIGALLQEAIEQLGNRPEDRTRGLW